MRSIEIKMPDNTIVDGPRSEKWTYQAMREFIGCDLIEIINLPENPVISNAILIVDEEGKLKNTVHINPTATMIAQLSGLQDVIVGSAIICSRELVD